MYPILVFSRLCFQCPPRIICRDTTATKAKEPKLHHPLRGYNAVHKLFVHL